MSLVTTGSRLPLERAGDGDVFAWQGHEVVVGARFEGLEAEWRTLDEGGAGSLFQSRAFLEAWQRHAAPAFGERPVFVAGRRDGALAFVLPLALTRRAGVSVLGWLAQDHANYGLPLAGSGWAAAIGPAAAEALLRAVARRLGAAVVHLDRQPLRWAGHANPFAAGRHARVTANDTFLVRLDEDFEAQHRRLFSAKTMSGLKRKRRRMEEEGPVSQAGPADLAERAAAIDWFVARKHAALAEEGQASPFDDPAIRALYHALAADPAFSIERLRAGDRPVAVTLAMDSGSDAVLLNTAHAGAVFARFSPGTLLLHDVVAAAHRRGKRLFDFGPGALPYKLEWEPEAVPLMATTFAASPLGIPLALALSGVVALKRRVKRDPRLAGWVAAIRRKRAAATGGKSR